MEPSAAQLPVAADFHSAPAANPTPNQPANAATHPPYAEMITAAISALRERNGSSKKAISKYIDRAYSNLPGSHHSLLTHHLKRLKESGQLLMVKKSYMLPRSGEGGVLNPSPISAAPAGTPVFSARRPGRPPKAKVTPEALSPDIQPNTAGQSADPGLSNGPSGTKKRPGRPPKAKTAALPNALVPLYPDVVAPDDSGVQAPPQADQSLGLGTPGTANGSATAKRRGRPPKIRAAGDAVSGGVGVAGGTPAPASDVLTTPRRRGRPKKYPSTPSVGPSGRPRGRPPKKAKNVADGIVVGGLGAPVRKRRGRPPLLPGHRMVVARKSYGRPVGRPSKDALAARKRESATSAELLRKLEFMRACIKSAVGVLRPYVIKGNAAEASAALSRLEELTSVEIGVGSDQAQASAPPPETAPEVEPEVVRESKPERPLMNMNAPADLS